MGQSQRRVRTETLGLVTGPLLTARPQDGCIYFHTWAVLSWPWPCNSSPCSVPALPAAPPGSSGRMYPKSTPSLWSLRLNSNVQKMDYFPTQSLAISSTHATSCLLDNFRDSLWSVILA